jgi:hypothetical protein
MNISARDVAWAAGLIDGLGSVAVYRYRYRYRTERGPFRYYALLRVAMPRDGAVRHLRTVLGVGRISTRDFRRGRKSSWVWACAAALDLERILARMRPHFYAVGSEVDIVLRFLRTGGDESAHRETLYRASHRAKTRFKKTASR